MLQEWHSAPRYCPVPWQWWSFFLSGLEGREALPAMSGGPVLQLLPPGHADGPSSASPGEVVVGQRRSSSMARTVWNLLLSRSWCVSLSLSSSGGT